MRSAFHRVIISISFAALALPAFAQLMRVSNTTLTNVPMQPPVFGYAATNAFGSLTFINPVAIVAPPGETNRLFIVEQAGIISVITNLALPTRTVFLDVTARLSGISVTPPDETGLLGLAFHPDYASNGLFFIDYTGNTTTTAGTGLHDILARYQVSASNPNSALPNETRLIVQYDEKSNHNGGDLHFGPDGYLYVSLGDEGGSDDSQHNSQRITNDFFSGILRIDVGKLPGSLAPRTHPASTTNYAVPPDNPFIGATQFNGITINSNLVHTEFWAVGLRNPWRFSFDPQTGILYCGDVGQGTREEVDLITRGSNYGWNYREGFIARPGSGAPPAGFNRTDPIFDYTHGSGTNQGFAVMGGVVYRGGKISQLNGAYVFGDNSSGNIWSLRYDGTNVSQFQRLFGQEGGVSAFGVDPRNGDVLWANQSLDTIRRLIYNTNAITGAPLPPTLADTGVFSTVSNLTPNPGIVPYDLNVPFWSDNAIKSRWFSLPNTNLAIGFNPDGNWSFPTGTVWIKHFELELTNGVASSRKRLETRLLVKNGSGIYGVTYRWGNSLTNATLVAEEGLDESFLINDGGIIRTQVWHYPGRSECSICHTPVAGFALGFNTAQLNRAFDYGSGLTNQIAALASAGYFSNSVPNISTLRSLVPATNAAISLEYRVRSYLAANCVQCHQPGGSAQAMWDARITTATELAGLVNGALFNNNGNTNNRVIVPGSLTDSMLLARLVSFGSLHMPPLATSVTNAQAVALISAWITNDLPDYKTFADWQLQYFNSTNSANSLTNADPDADGNNNLLEFLTGTIPTNNADAWKMSITESDPFAQINFLQLANRGFEVQFASNILSPIIWQPLDVPANAPFFSVTNRNAIVTDTTTNASRYYRVRVFTP